jgi:hypothetical protein
MIVGDVMVFPKVFITVNYTIKQIPRIIITFKRQMGFVSGF